MLQHDGLTPILLLLAALWALVCILWFLRDPAKKDPRWRPKSLLFLGVLGGLLSATFYDIGLRNHNHLALFIPRLLMLCYLGYIVWLARQSQRERSSSSNPPP